MIDCKKLFEGKKITVMGLGVLGRGVGDVAFLAKCGAHILVTDKKSEAELAESVAALKQYSNISYHLGGHDEKDFIESDMVLKAAGVPLDSPYIAAAKKAGVPVAMSTALFAKYAMEAGVKIVGVTGTRGKSTITHMIFHTLKQSKGLNRSEGSVGRTTLQGKVVLGGNVRSVSTLALLSEVKPSDIAVLELDSWQLQGFGDLHISPNVALFSNLMPDHQNYYKSMDEYFADKVNIFRYQHQGDTLIIGHSIEERVAQAKPPQAPLKLVSLPSDWSLKIPGAHNRENAALAAEALRAIGLSDEDIKAGLESFEGVEGRLQLIREIGGVKIYNDNNATTPEATIAALRALDTSHKNILLILGGSDKGLDTGQLISEIKKTCKASYLLAGTGSDRITNELQAMQFQSLEAALAMAHSVARSGDIILFSPAFASFGMFQNEYDRNDQFMKLVQML